MLLGRARRCADSHRLSSQAGSKELQSIRAAYEAARVDALLVADVGVQEAIDAYDEAFGKPWLRAASGTDWSPDQPTPYYDSLVDAMRDEVVDLSGGGVRFAA